MLYATRGEQCKGLARSRLSDNRGRTKTRGKQGEDQGEKRKPPRGLFYFIFFARLRLSESLEQASKGLVLRDEHSFERSRDH